jgi:hypothetical protein
MNRRNFLATAASAALATRLLPAETEPLRFALPTASGPAMAEDFVGLSYETGQLYNPDFFSSSNLALVKLFTGISHQGILRMGGHLSNITDWEGVGRDEPKQKDGIRHGIEDYWEWPLVDPSIQKNKRGVITRQTLKNLRGFLDATNWRLIYGLNFASGSAARAADEAAAVADIIGPRLIAFVIGNEVDGFSEDPVFRPSTYGPAEFMAEYQQWVKAIRARLPKAQFAGPDTEAHVEKWVLPFAQKTRGDLLLLTSHYYGMGPASNPAMTAERLLRKETPELDQQIELVNQARKLGGGVAYRMDEGNSCFGGGRKDVSDAYASALWAADYLLRAAAAGFAGVNFHGGGQGVYTPIESTDTSRPRPVYHGMQFASLFVGGTVARCELNTPANINAYSGEKKDRKLLGFIHKGADPVSIALPEPFSHGKLIQWTLTGPALDAKTGVRLIPHAPVASIPVLQLPAYSAILIERV